MDNTENGVQPTQTVSTPVTAAPAGIPPSPPSSMKKIIIAAVALLVVGGVGAYAYLNSAATPVAPKTIAQKANPNEPPPTLEIADDNGLKGSFVDTTQGTLQFDNTDSANFAAKQASLQAIYGNPATLVAGTNYLFANNDMTMADVYAAINPAANRILLATYDLGENKNATGFYTYPKGPFKGTFDIEHDTVNPQSGNLSKVLVKKNRAIVILAEKPSAVYGLHNSVEEPINALTSALLPADNLNGWTLVALKSGKLTDVIAPFKDRVASLWLLNSQNAFDQKADISATSTATITNSHIAWVNLNPKAVITSGFSDSNPDPCIASNTCSTAPTLTLVSPTPSITQGQELVFNLTGKNLIGATVAGPDSASSGLSILANSYKVTDTSISFIVVASPTAALAPLTAPANFKITAGTPATLFTQPVIVTAKTSTDAGFTVFPIAPQTITQGTSLAVSLDGVNLTGATVAVTPAVTGLTISTPVATATNLSFTITTTAATPAGSVTLTITAGGKTFTLSVKVIAAPTLTALATAPVVTQGQEVAVNLVGTNLATATIAAPAATTKLYISEASKKITDTSISFTLSAGTDAPVTTPTDIVITVGTTVFKQSVSVKAMVPATDPTITSLPLAVVDVVQGTPKVITIAGTNLTGAGISYPTTATGLTVTDGTVGTAAKPGTELKFTVNTTTATPVGPINISIKVGSGTTAVTFTQPINVKAAADTTAPTVTAVTPAPVAPATTVATTAAITATFSEAMDISSLTKEIFTVSHSAVTGGNPIVTFVDGVITLDTTKTIATFTPTAALAVDTTYVAGIKAGAKDLAGNALAAIKTWTFKTAAAADTTAPTVTAVTPADKAVDVVVDTTVTATFSEAMDATAITGTTFTLTGGTAGVPVVVPGAIAFNTEKTVATFTPTTALATSTTYTATITTGAKDLAGNALAAAKTWTFTTGKVVSTDPVVTPLASQSIIQGKTITIVLAGKNLPVSGVTIAVPTTVKGLTVDKIVSTATSLTFNANAVVGADLSGDNPANLTITVGTKTFTQPVSVGAKATDPTNVTFLEPISGAIALTDITKDGGIKFSFNEQVKTPGEQNTYLRDPTSGKYYFNYRFTLKESGAADTAALWDSTWLTAANFPAEYVAGDATACSQSNVFNRSVQVPTAISVWTCPHGMVPLSIAGKLTAGKKYTITGYLGNGVASANASTDVTISAPAVIGEKKVNSPSAALVSINVSSADLVSTSLVANGLKFTGVDSANTTSFLKDSTGNYYMKYNWLVSKKSADGKTNIPLFDTTDGVTFPGVDTDPCIKIASTSAAAGTKIWTCPYGKIPASAFAGIAAGDEVSISGMATDGKNTGVWKTQNFTVFSTVADATKPTLDTYLVQKVQQGASLKVTLTGSNLDKGTFSSTALDKTTGLSVDVNSFVVSPTSVSFTVAAAADTPVTGTPATFVLQFGSTKFNIQAQVIAAKPVIGAKPACTISTTTNCMPLALTSISTGSTDLTLASLKTKGLTFTAIDPNKVSNIAIGGVRVLRYKWTLENTSKKDTATPPSNIILFDGQWNSTFPDSGSDINACIMSVPGIWTCPYGVIPASAFEKNVSSGDKLNLWGTVGDTTDSGIGNGLTSVAITVK